MRRPDGAGALTHRRGDGTPKTQHAEAEDPNPVRALAQLRRLGLGLMTIGDENPAPSGIRVPHAPSHAEILTGQAVSDLDQGI
jgi:hypothetical protein